MPAKAEMLIVVLLLPRNQSHFLPACVSSHVDHSGIRWVHKQIEAAPGFEPIKTDIGYFLVNDPPPSKRADGDIFLPYVSDDFATFF